MQNSSSSRRAMAAAATATATATIGAWTRAHAARSTTRPFSSTAAGPRPGSFDCDVLVCGAGVVGLAAARAFARAGREVLVVEAAGSFGTQTSSRNSEVIHAGIYYPPGSLKARLCVEGRKMLYGFCAAHGVPHRRCGKMIVATEEQGDAAESQKLEAIRRRAEASGVADLRYLSQEEARALEPNVRCSKALFSPSTGILDSHQFMLALLGDAEAHGTTVAYRSRLAVRGMTPDGFARVSVQPSVAADDAAHGPSPAENTAASAFELRPRLLINASGLGALRLAREIAAHIRATDDKRAAVPPYPPPRFCKGNYFRLAFGPSPFTRLVYPLPEAAGLGVHATVDLGGQTRFGPDVEWVDDPEDLGVDPRRADAFYAAIRRYWPALEDGQLAPDYAGIRPKLQAPGDTEGRDFWVDRPAPGVINLLGIESPGLTASLALTEHVMLLGRG